MYAIRMYHVQRQGASKKGKTVLYCDTLGRKSWGERAIQGAKKTKQNVLETVAHFGQTKECFSNPPYLKACNVKWVHDSGSIVYKITLNCVLFIEHRQYSCTVYFPLQYILATVLKNWSIMYSIVLSKCIFHYKYFDVDYLVMHYFQ